MDNLLIMLSGSFVSSSRHTREKTSGTQIHNFQAVSLTSIPRDSPRHPFPRNTFVPEEIPQPSCTFPGIITPENYKKTSIELITFYN